MKVLIIIPSLGMGGAERAAALLSRSFVGHNHEVFIIIFHEPVSYAYAGKLVDIHVPPSSSLLKKPIIFFQRMFALRKRLQTIAPDRIISFLESANIPVLFANAGLGYKHIVSIQNNPAHFSFYHTWFLRLYKYTYKIVAVSDDIKKHLVQRYAFSHVEVVNNPIEQEYIQRQLTGTIPESVKLPYIFAAGRLTMQKGFDVLVKAFARVFSQTPVNLIIAGEGKDRSILVQLIQSFNLSDRILLLGNTPNLFPLYKHAMFFVLSSRWEGFGNVIVEALSCGCPVIASNCPYGPTEILNHGEYGMLVPPEDIEALSQAMKQLYEHERLRKNFSQKGLQRAAMYDINSSYLQWLT